MKAIRVHEVGDADKLKYEDVPIPEPGPGQVRIKIWAAGVNFIDVYFRSGLYKTQLPFTPGMEGAGVVDATGANVTGIIPGDRVAYAMNMGSYAEYALARDWHLVKLPDNVDFETGAAAMLQGMTAHYLALSTFPLRAGETALIHAGAGGVGLVLTQICKNIGARVISTVSTDAKRDLAREAGADHVILYQQRSFEAEVKSITGNRGVDVVYDSVGRTTFEQGLNCLRPRGMMVLFGQSSGPVPPIDLNMLNTKGSLYTTRPSLAHYISTREELDWRAGDVLNWLAEGRLKLRIGAKYKMSQAAEAHRALEARRTTGKVILTI